MNAVFFVEWLLILPSQHREYFISHEIKILSWTNQYQVIQIVTFLSPNVGGHQQPLKGSRELTIPKKVNAWITRYFMPGTPNNQFFNGCFQLDDSKSLHKKTVGNHHFHPLKTGFLPGSKWFMSAFWALLPSFHAEPPMPRVMGRRHFLVPKWPLFLKANSPSKQGLNSKQNKGPHLSSRYILDKNLYLSLFV